MDFWRLPLGIADKAYWLYLIVHGIRRAAVNNNPLGGAAGLKLRY